jgi:hypothetical protein
MCNVKPLLSNFKLNLLAAIHTLSKLLHYLGYAKGVTMLQAGGSRVRFRMRSLGLLVDLNLPAALWPWGRLSL